MDILKIEATKVSPEIVFNPITNIFHIKGVSHPENTNKFFSPVFLWMDQYYDEVKNNKEGNKIILNLQYKYINSSSFKSLIDLLKKFKRYYETGIEVEIIWFHEEDDEDMKEIGLELFEFSEIDLPRRFVAF